MANAEIPLFDLKAAGSYIFCAGGGGSKEYGRENGIVVAKKVPGSRKMSQIVCSYKTKDIITSIQAYVPSEDNEAANLSSPDICRQDSSKSNPSPGRSNSETDSGKKEEIFVAAIGAESFYLLRFVDSFTLLSKIERKVQMCVLSKNLFLLCNHEIYGFHNAIYAPRHIKIGPKADKKVKNLTEEYLYRLVRSGASLVPKNESGTSDIPSDWAGFFIHDKVIHKVILDKEKNVFVFKNEKYEVAGKMSRIVSYGDSITFYSNTADGGTLYFINGSKKVYRLPKITALGTSKEKVAVATCKGDIVVYSDGQYVSEIDVESMPVTGLSVDDEEVCFSVLTGEIEREKYRRHHISTMVLAAMLFLFLGILLFFLKYK